MVCGIVSQESVIMINDATDGPYLWVGDTAWNSWQHRIEKQDDHFALESVF